MKKIYAKCLAQISLTLSAMSFAGCARYNDLTLHGRAIYSDGIPIRSGEIVLTELKSRPFSMPKPKRLAVVRTDKEGKFEAKSIGLSASADIDVELLPVKCGWKGDSRIVTAEELVQGIDLRSERDNSPDCR